MGTIETVTSKDGAPIAYERLGHGPPLVMVHGSTVDRTRWGAVVPKLAEQFELYLVDRRGRGHSGDGPAYHIAREFEDVAAVLEATPAPAFLFAHSYGAICSIEALRLTSRIAKAAFYEPPMPVPGRPLFIPKDLGRRMEVLLAKNDRVGIVEAFMREVIHMQDADLARMRQSPGWQVRLAAAHTLPREVSTAYDYQFQVEAFANLRVASIFMIGGRSPLHMQEATQMAAAALRGSRVVPLPGHGHAAMSTGPRIFVDTLAAFFSVA